MLVLKVGPIAPVFSQVSMTSRFARVLCALALPVVGGCEESEKRPPPASTESAIDLGDLIHGDASTGDSRNVYARGSCEEGEKRQCRVYLPSHNDVQPCFVGEQVCSGSSWGECESGTLVDANDDDSELDPDTIQH